ncbi:MAG: hypothetical protein H6748_09075 [Spirochaetaceae bacterium]|nr:hypothetical protein [Spirochaetaceae bacterium]HPG27736.1 hypothetical protein [Myxococcota bacterium]
MTQRDRDRTGLGEGPLAWQGPSERESHSEHRAALDATVFRPSGDPSELVLELEAGELRVRRPADRP